MHLTLLFTLLPLLAVSTPHYPPGEATLSSTGDGNTQWLLSTSPSNQANIAASNNNFFVGIPTKSNGCQIASPESSSCEQPTNVTAISVGSDGNARMASTIWQPIYVNQTDGALAYQPAEGPRFDVTTSGFSIAVAEENIAQLEFNEGFFACPTKTSGVSKIYTVKGEGCASVEMYTSNYTATYWAAWSY